MVKNKSVFSSGRDSIVDEYTFSFEGDYNLLFRLIAPSDGENPWTIEYLIQSQADPSLVYSLEKVRKGKSVPPQTILVAMQKLAAAASVTRFVSAKTTGQLILTNQDAYEFLKYDSFKLKEAGFAVQIPKQFELDQKPIKLNIDVRNWAKYTIGKTVGDSMLEFDYTASIGGELMSPEEFKRIVESKSHLAFVKEKWVEINPEDAQRLFRLIKTKRTGAIRDLLTDGLTLAESNIQITVTHGGKSFESVIQAISDSEHTHEFNPPASFKGTLRSYQERGLAWLGLMSKLGLGALLADDMGLGKTVQIIAHIIRCFERTRAPVLIICPTSVIGNWSHEFERFVPSIKVKIHHGSSRSTGNSFKDLVKECDVLITSYALSRRDQDELRGIAWEMLILDEAQNIKNPIAKQTEILKSLTAKSRIALTGTPIENRISDIWSIMEFLNPGYLPEWSRFKELFAKPIEIDNNHLKKAALKTAIAPFILRRLKTDKSVITDLPKKIEKKQWCYLTPEQATLYQATVDASLKEIKEQGVPSQKLAIFAAITKLKQICNHPANFLKDSHDLGDRSGKVERLRDLILQIVASGESCLIFSQYQEMGALLYKNLKKELGIPIFFIHGGVSRKDRDKAVAEFQADDATPKMMILSLKAGGTGLNLTRATQVIHFDRWWNPAVENQATDRAYRIGQKSNVFVHKFVTKGTIEERIETILTKKSDLADSMLASGESVLARMSVEQIKDMFTLRNSSEEE
ncbi:DEAD/DEAH box helicase [Candidatus Woesearchaeota archaeon]|nr:DEAD/DEAH box helicase [Candidatus Woesearchaeota archaeon]